MIAACDSAFCPKPHPRQRLCESPKSQSAKSLRRPLEVQSSGRRFDEQSSRADQCTACSTMLRNPNEPGIPIKLDGFNPIGPSSPLSANEM